MISVSRPLDYEQIPNGLIYLTVMAKDAGNPPLNSTVPVTVEVFVSTQGCPSCRARGGECFPECWGPCLSPVSDRVPTSSAVPQLWESPSRLPQRLPPANLSCCSTQAASELSQGGPGPGVRDEPDGPAPTPSGASGHPLMGNRSQGSSGRKCRGTPSCTAILCEVRGNY